MEAKTFTIPGGKRSCEFSEFGACKEAEQLWLDSLDECGLPRDSPAQQYIRSQLHMRLTSKSLKFISRYVNICETGRYGKIIYHKQEEELNSMPKTVPQLAEQELIC